MIEMQMTETFTDIHKAYLAIIIKSENKVYVHCARVTVKESRRVRSAFSLGHSITNTVETQKRIYPH